MNWFSAVIVSVCTVAVLGSLLSGLGGNSGIFKCVRLVTSLVLTLCVINACLDTEFDFFNNFGSVEYDANPIYSEGVLKSFNEKLEAGVIKEIEKVYPNSCAEVYVISEIDKEYKINVIALSVSVKDGDLSRILNIIQEKCGIEKEKIFPEKRAE